MTAALPSRFYARRTAHVARALLGQLVVSDVGGGRTAGRIVETEAYVGPHDPACHAYGGRRTARTEPLYGAPGTAYIYFTYGLHWCLNAVTESEGYPAAVLIRALEPIAGVDLMRRRRGKVTDTLLCAGPARLCVALGVTGALNGAPLTRPPLRIVPANGAATVPFRVLRTGRIGVTTAADWPLRFVAKGSPWASKHNGAAPPGGDGARWRVGRC